MDQAQYKIWLINLFICVFIDGSADSVDKIWLINLFICVFTDGSADSVDNIWLINLFICVFTDGSVDSVSPELKGEAVDTSSRAYN